MINAVTFDEGWYPARPKSSNRVGDCGEPYKRSADSPVGHVDASDRVEEFCSEPTAKRLCVLYISIAASGKSSPP